MKQNKVLGIFLISVGLIIFVSSLIVILPLMNEKIAIDDLPCYDKRGNVIQGLVCEGYEYPNNDLIPILLLIVVFCAAGIASGMIYLMDDWENI